MPKIYYEPDAVWELTADKSFCVLLAECQDRGTEIYLDYEDEQPVIGVYIDGENEFIEAVTDGDECESTVRECYEFYLDSSVTELLEGYSEIKDDYQEICEQREHELNCLVDDFITEVCNQMLDGPKSGEVVNDLKEHFLAYMYRKHGLEPYRPMFVKTESGSEFKDYPYSILCS